VAFRPALWRYSQLTVAWAALVIFAGAMVTSTGSGMAVPDWPQSFGTWTPKMTGGVLFEHGHRMVAGMLGMLIAGLALWAGFSESRRWARGIAWAALIAVFGQALLGGLTVLIGTFNDWTHTHPGVSSVHACLAQAIFALLVSYATVSAPGWWSTKKRLGAPRSLAGGAKVLVALVYTQIILGAAMRHQQAGLIIYDFPLSYGRVIPEFYNGLVALNFAHRCGGWILVLGGGAFAWRVAADRALDPWVRHPAQVFLAAVGVQFLLGASAVWTGLRVPALTSAHVLGGSVVFTSAVVLALRLHRVAR
jgi:cytochrome c oxidase assembly protein subunit 15